MCIFKRTHASIQIVAQVEMVLEASMHEVDTIFCGMCLFVLFPVLEWCWRKYSSNTQKGSSHSYAEFCVLGERTTCVGPAHMGSNGPKHGLDSLNLNLRPSSSAWLRFPQLVAMRFGSVHQSEGLEVRLRSSPEFSNLRFRVRLERNTTVPGSWFGPRPSNR